MSLLVLVRHGQSTANLANVFTGWLDVALSPTGEAEAAAVAQRLRGLRFDRAYCSTLQRSRRTLEIILTGLGQSDLPILATDALKERRYGDLQGLNKAETVLRYGAAQVEQWRRSYDVAPPGGESLRQTQARAVQFFESNLAPQLRAGRHILVASHGNTLRGLRMYLEHLTPAQVERLEIATGGIRAYHFDEKLAIQRTDNL